jgi:DHA1 family multidrug resistance protein-like MFS transporter
MTALFLFTGLAESLAFGHFQAFTPLYLRELHVPAAQIPAWTGFLGMIGFILGLPLLPLWGPLAERIGRKPIIVRSAVIEAFMFVIASRAGSPYALALARFLSGFVLGNTGVMLALQAEVSPPKRVGLAIALVSSGPSVAIAAGPLLGGVIASALGLRTLFLVDAGLTALSAILLMLLLREPPRERSQASTGHLAVGALRDVLQIAPVRNLFLIYLLFSLGLSAVQPFLPLWIHALQTLPAPRLLEGSSAYVVGLLLTIGGVAMALGTPLLGWLGDRLGVRRALLASLFVNGVGLIGQGAMASLPALAVWRIVQGFGQGGVSATLMTTLARVAPSDRRASLMNLGLLPQQLSWFVGPLLGAAGTELLGLQPMLIAAGILAFLAWPLGLGWLPRLPQAAQASEGVEM